MEKFKTGRLLFIQKKHNIPLSIPQETAQAKFEQGYQDKAGFEALALFIISWLSHTDLNRQFQNQELSLAISDETLDDSWLEKLDLKILTKLIEDILQTNLPTNS